jgi:hypothetical protein
MLLADLKTITERFGMVNRQVFVYGSEESVIPSFMISSHSSLTKW